MIGVVAMVNGCDVIYIKRVFYLNLPSWQLVCEKGTGLKSVVWICLAYMYA